MHVLNKYTVHTHIMSTKTFILDAIKSRLIIWQRYFYKK